MMFLEGLRHIQPEDLLGLDKPADRALYWGGRTIRFCLEPIGALLDVALQVTGVAFILFWFIGYTLESAFRRLIHQKTDEAWSHSVIYIAAFLHELGEVTVNSELKHLLQDIGLRSSPEKTFNVLTFFFSQKNNKSSNFNFRTQQ